MMDELDVDSLSFVIAKLFIDLVAMTVIYFILESRILHTRSIFSFRIWNGGVPLENISNSYNGNYTQGKKVGLILFISTVVIEVALAVTLDIGFAPGIGEKEVTKTPSPMLGFPISPINLCVVTETGEGIVSGACLSNECPIYEDGYWDEDCAAFCDEGCGVSFDEIRPSVPIPVPSSDGDTQLSFVDGLQTVQKPEGWGRGPYNGWTPIELPHFTRKVSSCKQVSAPVALRIGHLNKLTTSNKQYSFFISDTDSPLSANVTNDDAIYAMALDGGWQRHFRNTLHTAGVSTESCRNADVSKFQFGLENKKNISNALHAHEEEDLVEYVRISCDLPLSVVRPRGICKENSVRHSLTLTGVSGRALHRRDARILGLGSSGCRSRAYEVTYDAYLATLSTCDVDIEKEQLSKRSIVVNEITGWSFSWLSNQELRIPLSNTSAAAIARLNKPEEVSMQLPNVTGTWSPLSDEGRIWVRKPKDSISPVSHHDLWVNGQECSLVVRSGWYPKRIEVTSPEVHGALVTLFEVCNNAVNEVRQISVDLPRDDAILEMIQFTFADSYANCQAETFEKNDREKRYLNELSCFNKELDFNIMHNIGTETYYESTVVPVVTWPFAIFLAILGAMAIYSAFIFLFRGRPIFRCPGSHYDWYLMGRRDAGDLKAGRCISFGTIPPDSYLGVARVSPRSDHLGITSFPLPEPSGRVVLGQPSMAATPKMSKTKTPMSSVQSNLKTRPEVKVKPETNRTAILSAYTSSSEAMPTATNGTVDSGSNTSASSSQIMPTAANGTVDSGSSTSSSSSSQKTLTAAKGTLASHSDMSTDHIVHQSGCQLWRYGIFVGFVVVVAVSVSVGVARVVLGPSFLSKDETNESDFAAVSLAPTSAPTMSWQQKLNILFGNNKFHSIENDTYIYATDYFGTSIPTEIGLLTSLTYLNFFLNDLTGTIPTEVGLLTSLIGLGVGSNDLTGTIPTEVGLLTSLSQLDVGSNYLTGTIPTEVGLLTSLSQLDVGANYLTGTIPTEVGLMTSLTQLDSYSNQLTGTVPTEVGLMTSLNDLSHSFNFLAGTVPTEIGLMTSLTELNLSFNFLTGTVPTEIGLMSSLYALDLANNRLTGTVPTEIGLMLSLYRLELNSNQLTGAVPAEILYVFRIDSEYDTIFCDFVVPFDLSFIHIFYFDSHCALIFCIV